MTTFFISDTHFGHEKIVSGFEDQKTHYGVTNERKNLFRDIHDHDETIIKNWNLVVGDYDTVYHLGDVIVSNDDVSVLSRLNGKKHLIIGNHDTCYRIDKMKPFFNKIEAYRDYRIESDKKIRLSHIPIHPIEFEERVFLNIHGHLHGGKIDDPRYFCCSCEHINYTPISLDEIFERTKKINISVSTT